MVGCLDPVHIGHHFAKAVDIIPDLLIVVVEDVWFVLIDLNARLRIALGVAVASNVRALVDEIHRMPLLRQFSGDDRAAESGSKAEVVCHGLFFVHALGRLVDVAAHSVKQKQQYSGGILSKQHSLAKGRAHRPNTLVILKQKPQRRLQSGWVRSDDESAAFFRF
jgi:hypothetical protein